MKGAKAVCFACSVLTLILSTSAGAAEAKAWDLFTRAIQNHSTAPNYVLITFVDDNNKQHRLVCIGAPFLLGAIHREQQIPYDDTGVRKAEEFALSHKDRKFHFSRDEALKNIVCRYDEKVLAEMRSALNSFSDEQLRKGFRGDGEGLDNLYIHKSGRQYSACRDAIAHVLLERGLLPRQGCVVGNLTVE